MRQKLRGVEFITRRENMRNISLACILVGALAAVLGGIARLTLTPIVISTRFWGVIAIFLVLFSVALNTLPAKGQS